VVVDDVTTKITHVIRGDDHLSNTPKQILCYEALGYAQPVFAHIPMILGPDRKRLSKRHGATSVLAFRDEGFLPEALVNYLARLGWAHGDQEVFTPAELIRLFDVGQVGATPAIFDRAKLEWLNQVWMKRLVEDPRAKALTGVRPYVALLGIRARPTPPATLTRATTPGRDGRAGALLLRADRLRSHAWQASTGARATGGSPPRRLQTLEPGRDRAGGRPAARRELA
jgi:glutamyl/glutaminyl-tRNA synthetase